MIIMETTQELDELYSIYKSLVGKEIDCTNKLLAAKDIEERNAFIDKARRFSMDASAVAKAIKDIDKTDKLDRMNRSKERMNKKLRESWKIRQKTSENTRKNETAVSLVYELLLEHERLEKIFYRFQLVVFAIRMYREPRVLETLFFHLTRLFKKKLRS